jgi:hypothetical protein
MAATGNDVNVSPTTVRLPSDIVPRNGEIIIKRLGASGLCLSCLVAAPPEDPEQIQERGNLDNRASPHHSFSA